MKIEHEGLTVNINNNSVQIYRGEQLVGRISWPETSGNTITLPQTTEPIRLAVEKAVKEAMGKDIEWDTLRQHTFQPKHMWMFW